MKYMRIRSIKYMGIYGDMVIAEVAHEAASGNIETELFATLCNFVVWKTNGMPRVGEDDGR
jgi:hypothetical protein